MKRKLALERISVLIFSTSVFMFLLSSIFLRNYNNSLTIEIQRNNKEIETIVSENDNIKVNIQTLSTKDRIYEIANESGLDINQENIISIYNGE